MQRRALVLSLGSAQTLAWASSYYLPAMIAAPMAAELGVTVPAVFATLSMALVVSALVGPAAGRLIDRHGGRPVLMADSVLLALGLAMLALAQGPVTLVAAWLVLGLAMGFGLYDAAFAALVHLYGRDARSAISGITLLGGLASTIGWPVTMWLESHWGWRGACAAWALANLLIGLPLNAMLPRVRQPPAAAQAVAAASSDPHAETAPPPPAPPRHVAPLLAAVFGLCGIVTMGIAAHLPALMLAAGAAPGAAVAVAALVGPAQVAGRLLELGPLRRLPALVTGRAATLGHPVGALALLLLGPAGLVPFALLHGLGNGLVTIVRGTLPLSLFGAAGYGARQGWLALPSRFLGAIAPWLFGLALQRWSLGLLWISAALGALAAAGLFALRLPVRR